MKRLWKKPAARIIAAAVVVVALTLLGLWVWSFKYSRIMSFDFLAGQKMMSRIQNEPGKPSYRVIREIYSFEADFNDVCEAADGELLALGFEIYERYRQRPSTRNYIFRDGSPGQWLSVTIYGRQKSTASANPESPEYPSPGPDENQGWVAVEVAERQLCMSPLKSFLSRFKMHGQPAAKQPRLTIYYIQRQ